ncbi:penicillin-binding protein 2 [Novosphingobium sp. FSY-8]|uniref:Penicillin-binding protein 2 n=1 Tax=Novosphingobium ovatum TaxID=1908523 RepID=A0ABW9XE96_9SPHN|nr:penicillin-binding protein 2 [Novosphingobium ovatum]NBC36840.1 penicillin-binding protein 2 [Novosphingobium ovatum]
MNLPHGAALAARPTFNAVISSARTDIVHVRRHAITQARLRALWVLLGFFLLTVVALARITHLGFSDGVRPVSDADGVLIPARADILDRNGVPLARAFQSYQLLFNPSTMTEGPPLIRSPREVAEALVKIFPDADVNELTEKLARGKMTVLRERILPEEANLVHALGEPTLEFPRVDERFYPQGTLAAHALGYIDRDGQPQLGMERALNRQLSDMATRATPQVLSIDSRVQGALEDELHWGMARSNARAAAGIVLDVETGEVVAMASAPTFNPNQLKPQDVDGRFNPIGQPYTYNRVTNARYEVGSVIKPITVASAIDAGVITNLARRYPAGSEREVGGHVVHDTHDYGASLNIPEALVHSSNIVLAQVGMELGPKSMMSTFRNLGFAELPAIELPARQRPEFPRGERDGLWSNVTTTVAAYGHGFSITPLHLASAYAALVNGGIWRPATLMKVAPGQVPAGHRVWQPATSARLRQLLRTIVQTGTGRKADAAGYRVGGKTGTAEVSQNGRIYKDRVIATFAGVFPMDRPRYVVIAMIEEPKATAQTGGRTAGLVAAPVVGRLVPRIAPLLGILPDTTRDIDIKDVAPLIADGNGE